MGNAETQRSLDEIGRLGMETYERLVRPLLRPEDDGKYVVVDIDTGDYELDEDDCTAVVRFHKRRPTAETFLLMVGQPTAYKILDVR